MWGCTKIHRSQTAALALLMQGCRPQGRETLLRNPPWCPAALGSNKLQFSFQNHNVGLHTGQLSPLRGLVFLLFVPSPALPWAVGQKTLLQIPKNYKDLFTETGGLRGVWLQTLLCPWAGQRLSSFLERCWF